MRSTEETSGDRARRPQMKYIPAIATAVLGILISLGAWHFVGDLETGRVQAEFAIAANNRSALIRQSLESEVNRLAAFRDLYARSGRFGREDFDDFTRTLLETEPAMQAIKWVPRVPGAQRQAYEEATRRAGIDGFEFIVMDAQGQRVRAPEADEYFPAYYVAPPEEVPAVLGFDLASAPERLGVLHRARDQGRMVLTSGRRIGEGPDTPYSALVHLPVFADNTVPETVEARRQRLLGFVVGTLRVRTLVENGISSLYLPGVDVYVYDSAGPDGRRLLYHHVGLAGKEAAGIRPDPLVYRLRPLTETFEVGGDRWWVVSKAVPGFVVLHRRRAPYPTLVLIGGLAFTALVSGYFLNNIAKARQTEKLIAQRTRELREGERQLRRDSERLEELVAERTRELAEANEGLAREVGERRRTEQTLRVRDRAISCADDAVAIAEHRGLHDNPLIYANPSFERITGYTVAESVGRDCRFLQDDDRDQPDLENIRAALREGRSCRALLRNYRKDGTMFWNELSIAPVQDESGKVTHYVATMADVTEQMRAEEEIREARRKYEALVQNIPQAVYSIQAGPPPKVAFLSERVKELAGLDPPWFYDNPDGWVECVHPEDRDRVRHLKDEAARKGEGAVLEYRLVHARTGEVRHVLDHSTAIKDDAGNVVRFDGTVTDITRQRKAEEDRRQLEAQVQHAQKLESLGVLAGGIAHDFNNMLVAILGNADLALMDIGEYSPARRSVEEIKRASIRASELTNQMLAYSGRGRFVVERVDLNELIREMGQLLKVSISKQAELKFQLAEALPAVEADLTQIRQVVLNLITNASDALSETAGTITVRTRAIDADRRMLSETYLGEGLPEGQYVLMEVIDTGCGMDEQTLERIFDPFFSTKFTGRGLGLAAVLGIVRGHRGTIRVRSRPGKGTAFSILLPSAGPLEHAKPARQTPVEIPSAAGPILVVDDEEGVRDVVRAMLTRQGLEVLTAENGREGVQVFSREAGRIAAVLLDLTMPVMGGQEAWGRMRAIRPSVPIILCSGYDEHEATQRFAGQGLAGFLQKPFELEALLAKLGAVMQKA
ncbi:MAG TPA: CHASE domain-containing protein [Phycisphaerae bacterium]|nr:CHASE domain-containing protein [Phycisphaerae bacterium]